ncbi:hypothetical protein [Xanthomonas arboricola]|uniref:hypothetical protein n=1 Tax=Xanthomonas arboricola TaxID=56448 RepID=UPI0015CD971C
MALGRASKCLLSIGGPPSTTYAPSNPRYGWEHRPDVATTKKIIRIIIEHADRCVFVQQEFTIESIRKGSLMGRW